MRLIERLLRGRQTLFVIHFPLVVIDLRDVRSIANSLISGELPHRHLLTEDLVKFFQAAIARLRKEEKGPDERKDGETSIYKTDFAFQATLFGVLHKWIDKRDEDGDAEAAKRAHGDGLLAELQSGRLCCDNPDASQGMSV